MGSRCAHHKAVAEMTAFFENERSYQEECSPKAKRDGSAKTDHSGNEPQMRQLDSQHPFPVGPILVRLLALNATHTF
jgi:hypothetical protein